MASKPIPVVNGGSQPSGASVGVHRRLPQLASMGRNLKIAQSKASSRNQQASKADVAVLHVEGGGRTVLLDSEGVVKETSTDESVPKTTSKISKAKNESGSNSGSPKQNTESVSKLEDKKLDSSSCHGRSEQKSVNKENTTKAADSTQLSSKQKCGSSQDNGIDTQISNLNKTSSPQSSISPQPRKGRSKSMSLKDDDSVQIQNKESVIKPIQTPEQMKVRGKRRSLQDDLIQKQNKEAVLTPPAKSPEETKGRCRSSSSLDTTLVASPNADQSVFVSPPEEKKGRGRPRKSESTETRKTVPVESASNISLKDTEITPKASDSPNVSRGGAKRIVKKKVPLDEIEPAPKTPPKLKEIKPSPVTNVILEKEKPPKWLVGDLVWSKVSGHPWWPCMISYDPYDGLYTKLKGGTRISRSYHVQFFGDDAERGWITEGNLLLFEGQAKFDEHVDNAMKNAKGSADRQRLMKLYKVPPQRKRAVDIGVKAAESALPLDRNDRKQQFTFTYALTTDAKSKSVSQPAKDKKKITKVEQLKEKAVKRQSLPVGLPNGVINKQYKKLKKHKRTKSLPHSNIDEGSKSEHESPAPTSPIQRILQKKEPSFENFYEKQELMVQEEHPEFTKDMIIEHLQQEWNMMSVKQRARYKSKFSEHGHLSVGAVSRKRQPKPSLKKLEAEEDNKLFAEERKKRKLEYSDDESLDSEMDVQPNKKRKPGSVKRRAGRPSKSLSIDYDSPSANSQDTEEICSEIEDQGKSNGSNNTTPTKSKLKCLDSRDLLISRGILDIAKQPESKPPASAERPQQLRCDGVNELDMEIFKLSSTCNVKKENVCKICEKEGVLIECDGLCQNFFHQDCLGLTAPPVDMFKCDECLTGVRPCFVCQKPGKDVRKCSSSSCGKFYHENCIKSHPRTKLEGKGFLCPLHFCATCFAENPSMIKNTKMNKGKLFKCMRCPTAYHAGETCIAAGSKNLPGFNIVCSNHFKPVKTTKHHSHVNVNWCFICNKGGTLLCCESCPSAFHADCLKIDCPDEKWCCEDCINGKKPLYGDIVWVKLGTYRWWPGEICHPSNVPLNIQEKSHQIGEFPVRFFGSHDYFWLHQARVFLFQEGDKGNRESTSKGIAKIFSKGLIEANQTYRLWKKHKDQEEQIQIEKSEKRPAPYKFVRSNIPLGNVQIYKADLSEINRCECKPDQPNPCGKNSECLNRMLLYECHASSCPAGEHCQNQRFQKRQYPKQESYKTDGRGWGLKTLEDIKKGQFVNEYVGDLIDEEECRRRMKDAHENNISNFYMLTLDKNRIIDAGPKGNLSRFMNHSCQPNLETEKWNVNGDVRVGLFAIDDIPAGSELLFNYNFECLGNEKTVCCCGAPNCSGFLGVRPKTIAAMANENKGKKDRKKKKRKFRAETRKDHEDDCFRCGEGGELVMCDRIGCPKVYHLQCLNLTKPPHGKWLCPWHHCDVCGKVSTKKCVECPNSFCSAHTEGNITEFGGAFICSDHDDILDGTAASNSDIVSNTSDSESQHENTSSTNPPRRKSTQQNSKESVGKGLKRKASVDEEQNKRLRRSSGKSKNNGQNGGNQPLIVPLKEEDVKDPLAVAPMFDDDSEDEGFSGLVIDIPQF